MLNLSNGTFKLNPQLIENIKNVPKVSEVSYFLFIPINSETKTATALFVIGFVFILMFIGIKQERLKTWDELKKEENEL